MKTEKGLPKWVRQVMASCVMLVIIIAALYYTGKDAGSFVMMRHFFITAAVSVYIIGVLSVSFDAELRGVPVWWVSLMSIACLPLAVLVWFYIRPAEYVPFSEMDDFDDTNETA